MSDTIGLLIMTHGDFGKAAIESAELIVGKQENYDTMSVFVVDQVDDLKQEMFDKADQLATTKGLLVLTDIVGGTPINLASYLLERENTIVASGVNLPMLLEVLMARTGEFATIEETLRSAYSQVLKVRTNADLEGEEDDEYSL
jgi:PTS system mannose-specific IIA component